MMLLETMWRSIFAWLQNLVSGHKLAVSGTLFTVVTGVAGLYADWWRPGPESALAAIEKRLERRLDEVTRKLEQAEADRGNVARTLRQVEADIDILATKSEAFTDKDELPSLQAVPEVDQKSLEEAVALDPDRALGLSKVISDLVEQIRTVKVKFGKSHRELAQLDRDTNQFLNHFSPEERVDIQNLVLSRSRLLQQQIDREAAKLRILQTRLATYQRFMDEAIERVFQNPYQRSAAPR